MLLLSILRASNRTLMICLIIIHYCCLMRRICFRFLTAWTASAWCFISLWAWILAITIIVMIFIFFLARIFALITRANITMVALWLLFTREITVLFFNRANSRYLVKYAHAFLSYWRISISIEETCSGSWAYTAKRVTDTAFTWWVIHATD